MNAACRRCSWWAAFCAAGVLGLGITPAAGASESSDPPARNERGRQSNRARAVRVVSLTLWAPPRDADALRASLAELCQRLGVALRDARVGDVAAWAELSIDLETPGAATVVLRDGRTQGLRMTRELRDPAPPAVLVEMTAAVAYGGLEMMAKDEPVTPPKVAPLARRPVTPATDAPPTPSRAPTTLAPAIPTVPLGPVPVAPPPPAAPPPAPPPSASTASASPAEPSLDPLDSSSITAVSASPPVSTGATDLQAPRQPRGSLMRIAAESSLAVAPYQLSLGAGLAAALSLPTVPLAPRLALGVMRWQSVGERGLAGGGANLVVAVEAAAALVHARPWSWHLGPRLTWARITRADPEQSQSPSSDPWAGDGRGPMGPPPGVPRALGPVDVFELGLATRLAFALGSRAEIFAAAAATHPLARRAVDPARDQPEGSSWTVTGSLGFAFALTSPSP